MITTAIVFDHRNRTKKNDEGPIEIRVTVNRKPYYIQTGVRVRARQWAFDKVINHPQSDVLNERLSILLSRVMSRVNAAIEAGIAPNITQIRKNIWETASETTLIDWIREEVSLLNIKEGTLKHYTTLLSRLEEYGELKTWQDVSVEGIYKWDAWLHTLNGDAGKITDAGVHNYHKCLKALLTRAVRSGKIATNPYALMRGEFSKGERDNTEYLTEAEMNKILKLKPTPNSWLERARDLFVFQMYTGLSYADAQAFDISKYKKVQGKWRIVGNRIKNGEPFVNQLLPPAVEVLEKYGMKVPELANQVYNRELKAVGLAAGIDTPLHSHLARHTFATFMLRSGAKIENVSKMLGHTNIKTTQRYAKVLAESVHEDFDMIEKKLKAKKKKTKR